MVMLTRLSLIANPVLFYFLWMERILHSLIPFHSTPLRSPVKIVKILCVVLCDLNSISTCCIQVLDFEVIGLGKSLKSP